MKPDFDHQKKVVITVAPTGGLHGREANAALPEQPEAIVENFYQAWKAGAAVAHIHVRDKNGRTSADLSIYQEVLDGIMSRCPGMITQVGNGIGIKRFDDKNFEGFTLAQRMKLLDLKPAPDMLTVNSGTFHFDWKGREFLFENSKAWNAEFIQGCQYRGIVNELECYDLSHIQNMLELRDKGVIKGPMHFSFVMGITGGIPASPQNLFVMLDHVPEGSSWQVVAIGKHTLPLSATVLASGGNIRVGMEDNVYYSHGVLATSNLQLVERAVRIAKELNRDIATPDEARKLLHMGPPPQTRKA